MCTHYKKATVFQLLALSCGIALKIILNSKTEQAFKTKFKCFSISSYLDTVENATKIEEITVSKYKTCSC